MTNKKTLCTCLIAVCVATGVWAEWDVSLNAGATKTAGNSDTLLLEAGLESERKTETLITTLSLSGRYGESVVDEDDGSETTEITAQSAEGHANIKRLISELTFIYLDLQAQHDDLADLEYRVIGGPGAGYFFIKNDTHELSAEIGVGYVAEEVQAEENDYLVLRLAEEWTYLISDTSKAWQKLEYLPTADEIDVYLLNAEAGLEAALSARVNLRLVVKNRYNSSPAPDTEKNDLSVVSGVVLKL